MSNPSTFSRPVLRRWAAMPVAAALLAAVAAQAAPASPDPGFGAGDGLVLLDVSLREVADAVLPLPDGRTVVVGTDLEGQGLYVARLQPDGRPDVSFGDGGGGARFVPFGDSVTAAGAVLRPDGAIVVAGTVGFTSTDMFVARLSADGELDPSFGTGGWVAIGAGRIDQAFDLAVGPDGAIVVVGRGGDDGASAVAARVTAAGMLDPGFGSGGVVSTQFGTSHSELHGVGIQSDGAVIVGGLTSTADNVQPLVARLTATGETDASYGSAGRVDPTTLPASSIRALAVDSVDRAVVVGPAGPEEEARSIVARVTGAGAVDPAFGTNGVTMVSVSVRTVLSAVTLDGAGRVVVSGLANPTGNLPAGLSFGVVARLTASGGFDPGFGCGGTAVLEVPAEGGGSTSSVAVTPAGQVLLGGLAFLDDDIDIPRSDSLVIRLGTDSPGSDALILARADGGVTAFGAAPACGSLAGTVLNRPVVGVERTPSGEGYWLVASDGGVFAFGDARFAGSTGGMRLNRPVEGIAADPDGSGYWLVAADGGIFAFDAPFFGSTGNLELNGPVVGMAPTASGQGYWLVAADGGVFAFGDARFAGSTGGMRLNRPVEAMAADPDGSGYWLVASDGGVFAFDAAFAGSTGDIALHRPIVALVADSDGSGYWLVASDGRVFAFDAAFAGAATTPAFEAGTVGAAG